MAKNYPFSKDVDLDALARREECNNLTGADLASLVSFACGVVMFEFVGSCIIACLYWSDAVFSESEFNQISLLM